MTEQPEAGPALDALVAERVFGYLPREKTPWGWRTPHDGATYITGGKVPMWSPYSTDIAAAWHVVEYVRRQIFSDRLAFKRALGTIISARVRLSEGERVHPEEWLLLLTPEDICRAALAALGDADA